MGKSAQYIIALLVVFAVMYGIQYLLPDKPAPLSSQAVDPDLHFRNSRAYVKDHSYDRSMDHLDEAIEAIREIEGDLDEESRILLEEAVADLEIVRKELAGDSLRLEDMNVAYSEALNALTEVEVKVTKALLQDDRGDEARLALKYGMYHLKNTLKFTQGKKKDYEIHIYEEIDSLLENKSLSHDEMMRKLDHIIEELDSLHQDNLKSKRKQVEPS
jgi:hypothetical protein